MSGRLNPRHGSVRVAFVGRRVEHARHALGAPAAGYVPVFVDVHAATTPDELLTALRDATPDIVVAFAPERLPAGLLGEIDAVALGVLDEPLEPAWGSADPWDPAGLGPELLRRAVLDGGGVDRASAVRVADFDRLCAWDPLVARVLPDLGIWRSPPPPVDDALFGDERLRAGPPHPVFLGESTEHREAVLIAAKHAYDLSHFAFGLEGERLREVLHDAELGVVAHPGPVPSFTATVPLHLAAGQLLLSEPLVPSRGLEPDIDHLEFRSADELLTMLFQIRARPMVYEQVRVRGRAKSEGFRASHLWPRLLGDLATDLDAFGPGARRAVATGV